MPRAFFKSQFFKSQNHVLNHLAYLHAQSPLFSGTSNIPLETAQQMVSTFDRPCKWWFVFSLNRTDADRLQIDRGYFQQLLESQKGIWAKAYNIPPERLHIYASYHDLDHHPHVHVVLHGERPSDGFIHCPVGTELGEAFKQCRQTVKSSIANEIFRADSETLKKDHSQQRQELNKELDRLLLEIGHSSHPIHPDIQRAMQQLSTQLAALPGKHVYGYLPADLKLQVDNLLEEVIKKDAQLAGMFETYKTTHRAMIDHLYVDSPITLDQKMADWENKFFHPVKGDDTRRHNIILQAAEALATPARERNKKDTGSPHSWEEPEPFTPNEPEPSADTDDMEIFLDLDADAGAANEPGEPPGRKPATQEEQTALDQLMRTIQRTAEKEILRHAPAGSLGEKLLAIRNLSNPTGPLPRYAKMSDQQQEIVRSAVQQIAALPAVQAALRGKPKELMQWSDAELLEYCTAPETSRLYRFVASYAARATAKSPIDPLLPEIRRADYKLLCALDAALCNSLNAPMEDSRFRSAATDLARRIYTRDNDREALENPPQFYKQLFPPHQEEVWQMLSDYFQVGSVANALHTRKALSDIPDSFEHFTNDTRYLNLVLERLRERWESPDKPLVIKYQFSSLSYYHKTVAAIIRSGLYAIASTLKDDSQRTSSQSPKTGKKLQKKRIHHQTIEERHEQSHDR